MKGNAGFVQKLVTAYDADVNIVGGRDKPYTPLQMAAEKGDGVIIKASVTFRPSHIERITPPPRCQGKIYAATHSYNSTCLEFVNESQRIYFSLHSLHIVEHLATHPRKLWSTLQKTGVFTQVVSNIKEFARKSTFASCVSVGPQGGVFKFGHRVKT